MSANRSRREFLADVGRGTLIAAIGSSTAADLGLARAGRQPGAAIEFQGARRLGRAHAGDAGRASRGCRGR